MGITSTNAVVFILMIASVFCISMANRGWGLNGYQNPNNTHTPRKIIVGGDKNWTFGYNYRVWARDNSPFYVNDSLVFRYDPPSETNIHPHNVYLLPNESSFQNCELRNAHMVANFSDGGGDGFEFVLRDTKLKYFACTEENGRHCKEGLMKFYVSPRWPVAK